MNAAKESIWRRTILQGLKELCHDGRAHTAGEVARKVRCTTPTAKRILFALADDSEIELSEKALPNGVTAHMFKIATPKSEGVKW